MALTLSVRLPAKNMESTADFYDLLGVDKVIYFNPPSISYSFAPGFNLHLYQMGEREEVNPRTWGKLEIGVKDVDSFYNRLVTSGLKPEYSPHLDAQGGKKAFEIKDPSGNQICFFSAH